MSINTRGNKAARPPGDFELQLDRQLGFLRRSCAAFDGGASDEAVRIALAIRVLLHNTGQSTSLLKHLGIQTALSYVDTGIYRARLDPALQVWIDQVNPGHILAASSTTDVGLVELGDAGEGRVGWFAPLRLTRFAEGTPQDKATRGVATFDAWWRDPLVESSSRKSFSLSDLILIMANQDGGGHVDAGIDADYRDLIVDPLMAAEHGPLVENKTLGRDIPNALHNVAFASVRQIAFEFLCTIDRYDYVKSNLGVFAFAKPFNALSMPAPPHRPVNILAPIIMGRLEHDRITSGHTRRA